MTRVSQSGSLAGDDERVEADELARAAGDRAELDRPGRGRQPGTGEDRLACLEARRPEVEFAHIRAVDAHLDPGPRWTSWHDQGDALSGKRVAGNGATPGGAHQRVGRR